MKLINNNVRVFWALLRRDLYGFKKSFFSILVDNIFVLIPTILSFGYLIPLMGMPLSLIGPLFIGVIFIVAFVGVGYIWANNLVHDLHYSRFIEYQLSLPISKVWLFAEFVCFLMIQALCVTLPLFVISILFLGNRFAIQINDWFALLLISLLSLLFMSTMFLYMAFAYSYEWFLDNLWPRRLSPLITVGGVFIPWWPTYQLSKFFGIVFLFNPFTAIVEGLRAGLLGNGDSYFIPIWVCIALMIVFNGITIIATTFAIKKRLDPV